MTEVRESTVIELPYHQVLAYLERWLGHEGAAAGSSTLSLRAPLRGVPGIDAALHHDADVSYVVTRDPTSKDRTHLAIALRWTPTGGGPYPAMWGLITLRDAGERSTKVELDGHYSVPFSAAGLAFDKVIGARIASATVSALLLEMRAQVLAFDVSAH